MHHLGHLRHRIAAWESLTEPGTDQQISCFDISRFGHMAQLEIVRIAGAHGDRTQSVAVDLHRNAMGDIGQQQHARGIRQHLDDLPHQAAGIEHRLPHEDAVLLALVDQDAMGERVRVEPDQLGDDDLVIHQRRRVEQLAQAHVLLGEHRQLLQAPLHQQRLGLELLVLGHQAAATGDLLGRTSPDPHRHVGDPVERRQYQPHLAAYRLQRVEACIHHHQHDTKHDEHQQAHTEQRSLGK